MKGIVLASLMVVGILVFAGAALGVTYVKYDEATTNIILEDGIKCTIDGKDISNGETVTSNLKGGYLNVHVESDTPIVFGYSGVWYSDDVSETKDGDSAGEVTSYDFKIPFSHGKYNGTLLVRNMASDEYGCPISMVLHFDESKIMVWFSMANSYRHDGETVTALGNCVFDVKHVDGTVHTFTWDGSWGNDWGDHEVLQGTKSAGTVKIRISSIQSPSAPSSGEITFALADN